MELCGQASCCIFNIVCLWRPIVSMCVVLYSLAQLPESSNLWIQSNISTSHLCFSSMSQHLKYVVFQKFKEDRNKREHRRNQRRSKVSQSDDVMKQSVGNSRKTVKEGEFTWEQEKMKEHMWWVDEQNLLMNVADGGSESLWSFNLHVRLQ